MPRAVYFERSRKRLPCLQVKILWAALRACFDNEADAIAAAVRSPTTILPYVRCCAALLQWAQSAIWAGSSRPRHLAIGRASIATQLNSPGNIYGCYAYLVEELGVEDSRDVCTKNPGVLACNPNALRQTSAEVRDRVATRSK